MELNEQKERLRALRERLREQNLAAFLVPRADEHQGEYVPAASERLRWLSGFTGSAGLAIVGLGRAALFADGRYTLQAREQAPPEVWEHHHLADDPPEAWLASWLQPGDQIGFDPWLHTTKTLAALRRAIERKGAVLRALERNPVDELWPERPPAPHAAIELYPDAFAGETAAAKRQRIAEQLGKEGLGALVITAPDNLAWLFNIRGGDLEMTPVALGYGILRADATATLIMDAAKVPPEVRRALEETGAVAVADRARLGDALAELRGLRVRVDETTASLGILAKLGEAQVEIEEGEDFCSLAKACKTAAQLEGLARAHLRDGVAVVRFLKWLSEHAPGAETEWTAAARLHELRVGGEHYRSPSFQTISAAGANGAYCHYTLKEETAAPLREGELYLIDSGAQYFDGTTDITRTVILGLPTEEMRRRYTQVLKGHIAIATVRFPRGTTGGQLDVLARQFLWQDGVDFDHGTGHGVGSFLSVHEGPQSIAKRPSAVLQPGMVLSNEPGYYKSGEFGIRLENLLAVEEVQPPPTGAERPLLAFATLSLAPFDRRLIDVSLLTESERAWVDAYHARTLRELAPRLAPAEVAYLAEQTATLA